MRREIQLDGGEITILKTLGLSGSAIYGKLLIEKIEMENAELIDALDGLVTRGYVLSSKVNVSSIDDVERAFFRVNAAYARDLRDAIRPGRKREDDHARRKRRA